MTEPPPYGSLEMLRETAVEQLNLASFHAGAAADQGAVCADAGMVYNAKRAIAHLRMAGDVLTMMHEHRQREILRRVEREGAAVVLGMERQGEGA